VIDESHYCKNPRAKRTQAVRSLAASVTSDGLRLALTGTPVLNHADELIEYLQAAVQIIRVDGQVKVAVLPGLPPGQRGHSPAAAHPVPNSGAI